MSKGFMIGAGVFLLILTLSLAPSILFSLIMPDNVYRGALSPLIAFINSFGQGIANLFS